MMTRKNKQLIGIHIVGLALHLALFISLSIGFFGLHEFSSGDYFGLAILAFAIWDNRNSTKDLENS